jgi:hypothetical protein
MSSTVKRGDVVILVLGSKRYNALVNQVNTVLDSHCGADGEPTLHLSYVPDDPLDTNTRKPKVMPIGYIPDTVLVHSVVHRSHEFSAAYMQQHGLRKLPEGDPQRVAAEAEIRNRRGAGEWMTVEEAKALDAADPVSA